MKFCLKHINFITKLDEYYNINIVLIRFIRENIKIEEQDYVENLKNGCPCCYKGFDGRKALRSIVLEEKNKRLVIKQ